MVLTPSPDYIHVSLAPPRGSSGGVEGLLGNLNGIADDDLMAFVSSPNDTDTDEEIFYNFGLKCMYQFLFFHFIHFVESYKCRHAQRYLGPLQGGSLRESTSTY